MELKTQGIVDLGRRAKIGSERMDWPEPERLKAAIEASKKYLQLSHDVGASSLRVFPNQFHPNVPKERTIGQIAKAVNDVAGQRPRRPSEGENVP